jgi:peptide/nickel transport system substrate-binding protein
VGFDVMRTTTIQLHQSAGALFGDSNIIKGCREDIFKVCPGLAESWAPSSDFTQWTFKVRDNVLWHDGKPFTAEDVKFWFDLAFSGAKAEGKTRPPAVFKGGLGDLKLVEVLPGSRVRVTLDKPDRQYLETLMNPRHKIAHPKHLMEPRVQQGDVNVAPIDIGVIGTGPFKFFKYDKGSIAQVRRFDRYWEKDAQGRQLPYMDGIDYVVIYDESAIDAAFRTRRLDGVPSWVGGNLTPERQAGYVRDLGDEVWFARYNRGTATGVGFNLLRPGPWQDVRVRKAISLWVDKDSAIPARHSGFGQVGGILLPANPFVSPDLLTWPGFNPKTKEQDRAEAKRLLAEAGYAKGFTMGMLTRRVFQIDGEWIHGQLAGLNIQLQLQLVDEAGWARGRISKDYDTDWWAHVGPPFPEATRTGLARYSVSPAAIVKHEDPKIDELFDRLLAATSFEERARGWRAIERYVILDQVYFIPTTDTIVVLPFRKHVKGFVVPGEGAHNNTDYATVWLDK